MFLMQNMSHIFFYNSNNCVTSSTPQTRRLAAAAWAPPGAMQQELAHQDAPPTPLTPPLPPGHEQD
jgi:hypothetical protein